MTNNCIAVAERERTQDHPEMEAGNGQQSVAEQFGEALARCKDEAGCLDSDPIWDELDEREKAARLLGAMGFASKASRYRDCHVTAVPVDCVACQERYYSRYRCTLRYCHHCGPLHFSRIMARYREPITHFLTEQCSMQPSQRNRTLAMLTFTVRSYDRIPERSEPRQLNKLVRRWFRQIFIIAEEPESNGSGSAPEESTPEQKVQRRYQKVLENGTEWGCIFAVETGHERPIKHPGRKADGWNLHVHVLYYGPYLDWDTGLRLWKGLTSGDGQGFYIKQCPGWRKNPEQAVRRALVHHFGYIMKPAAISGERIAALEVLFSGVRRVHALGDFYGLPKPEENPVNPRCPKCGHDLPINLRAWQKSERRGVSSLESEGRRDWRAIETVMRRAQALGGQSP